MKYIRQAVYICLALNLFAVMFGWWKITGSTSNTTSLSLIALGRLTGILATLTILLEFITMSRAPFLEKNFSLGELTNFHKWNGYLMTWSLVAHIVFLTAGYGILQKLSLWDQFLEFNRSWDDVFKATIGSVILAIAVWLSVQIIRQRLKYEVWYLAHLSLYASVVLAFMHQLKGGDFIGHPLFLAYWYAIYAFTAGLIGWYRFARPLILFFKHDFRVQRLEKEAEDIYSIYLTGKSIHKYKYDAGQFATWRFLNRKLILEGHPFSFSSEPGSDTLRLTFKASGDYTKKLPKYIKMGTKVLIDGPRGNFSSVHANNSDEVILIAGGIGIAPFINLSRDLISQGKRVQLVYAVQQKSDIAFSEEISNIKTEMFIEDINGRIEKEDLEKYAISPKNKTFYICGPPQMIKSISSSLISLGLKNRQIITEKFTL